MLSTRELAALTKSVATVIREHVAKLFSVVEKEQEALAGELQALRTLVNELPSPKEGIAGKDGSPGRDGVDGKDGLAGTHGTDGAPGINGKDGCDGVDGKDGTNGKDGPPGRDGIDGKSVSVHEVLELMPKPKDGENGIDGKSVTVDELLPTVKAWFDALPRPRDGVDGKSVTVEDISDFMWAQFGKWALEFERHAHDTLQRCVDRIEKPQDGKAGTDGVGFDDMTVEQDGPRTFKLRFVRGERVKEFSFSLPVVLDCGVYIAGKQYAAGDSVSFGGSLWIAQKDSPGKPGDVDSGWRLAVKKGRDGRDREVPVAG